MSERVVLFLDAARVPIGISEKLRDGATLSGIGDTTCLVASVVNHGSTHVAICRLCPPRGSVGAVSTYEYAEALALQHLRQKHSIYLGLWTYNEELVVHSIL